MFVVKVKDVKISMPKLNLKVILEYGESYKHNIPDVEDSESSLSTSQMP